jgi:hypothetical protein
VLLTGARSSGMMIFHPPPNSDSVLEMFSVPPLGRPSQQQRQERSSSSLSNITTNSMQSPANEGVSNAARRRVPLGPFVFTSNGRTGIRSTDHANGLIGILQLAGAHPSRLIGTLGGTIIVRLGFKKILMQPFNRTDHLVG